MIELADNPFDKRTAPPDCVAVVDASIIGEDVVDATLVEVFDEAAAATAAAAAAADNGLGNDASAGKLNLFAFGLGRCD